MTVLLIGGRGQGKRMLAARLFGLCDGDFLDGEVCGLAGLRETAALDRLHLLTRRMLEQGESPAELLPSLIGKIVICDELGCGIVPIDRADEDWRECTGRLCCDLAAQADLVIRVTAGLPQVLKGVLPCA